MRPLNLLVALLLLPAVAFPQTQDPPKQDPPKQEQSKQDDPKNTDLTPEVKSQILDAVRDTLENRAFVPGVDFKKWDELTKKYQVDFDRAQTDNGFAQAVNRALREIGVSHVGLRTPRSAQQRRTGEVTGHGINARKEGKTLVVVTVTPKSPAETAGLQPGDEILTVNGKPAEQIDQIPSGDGEPVTLGIKHKDGKELTVPLVAKQFITGADDTLTWLDDDTAILKLHSFSRTYNIKNIDKMMTDAAKAKKLIIDLRNNGGGAVSNLGHFLGEFIDSDTPVGTFVSRRTLDSYTVQNPNADTDLLKVAAWSTQKFRPRKSVDVFKGKVAVLINRGSASASEIFAAAMQDTGRAKIVGSDSRGAVLASVYGRLPGGFEIQYPVSDYVTIKGVRLEGHPVKPDVEATGRSLNGDSSDPVVQAAVKALDN